MEFYFRNKIAISIGVNISKSMQNTGEIKLQIGENLIL